ncbi:MAG: hypothetical protein MZV63_57595 [Marinilabiliales bacterium]|nr:hypothetical protein [Marinilabiliales bacterium]
MRVRPSLLLGLPFDDYDAVIDSFDFLGMAGLGQDALVAPLAILPGTRIRDRAEDLGIKEYLRRPPYYVMETEWIDEDGIADAAAAFEESFDVALAPPVAPNFEETIRGYRSFADLRKPGSLDGLLVNPETLGNSMTLLLSGDDEDGVARLARTARDLRKENPFGLYQIVLYSDKRIPGESVQRKIADAFIEPDHWYELSRIYSLDPSALSRPGSSSPPESRPWPWPPSRKPRTWRPSSCWTPSRPGAGNGSSTPCPSWPSTGIPCPSASCTTP